jgi:undecaprenyl diphosphate synthase
MVSIEQIDKQKLPLHIAIIMDGNGRWAKKKGNKRIFGHNNAVAAVRDTVEAAAELGLSFLTLYTFSTENWNRPKEEVDALMSLLISTISSETRTLMDNNIKLAAIGNIGSLPQKVRNELDEAIEKTSKNSGLTLVLALSYSSRWEITNAIQQIAVKIENGQLKASQIDEKTIEQHLTTCNIPDPELLIRTSGEYRISNFLLWQIAYCELFFTDVLWPDFRKVDLYKAIISYQGRERRFGKTSEQIENNK